MIGAVPKEVRSAVRPSTIPLPARRGLTFTTLFAHAAFITCLCLQRVGFPFGEATISISLPVLIVLALSMIVTQRAYVPAQNAFLFALFVCWSLLSALGAVLDPDPRVGFSIFSQVELLAIYLPLLIRPRGDFDSSVIQRTFLFYVRLCAVLGILQFLLQFAHIRLFSVTAAFPAAGPWLLEKGFAVQSAIKYGSWIMRSNGFFLLEPSIFSQVLALGILLDVFIHGHKRYLPLYIVAYITSYAGTGLLSLMLTLAVVGLTSARSAARIALVGVIGAVALGLFALVFPSQVSTYLGRVSEFQSTQTSAYARYLAPLAEMKAFAGETRSLLGYGPGATSRATSYAAGSGNAALQLFVDYGAVGACFFFVFLIAVLWRPGYVALSLFLLFNFQFGGGYLLAAPIVMLMAVLGIWGTEQAWEQSSPGLRRVDERRSLGRFAGGRALGRALGSRPFLSG